MNIVRCFWNQGGDLLVVPFSGTLEWQEHWYLLSSPSSFQFFPSKYLWSSSECYSCWALRDTKMKRLGTLNSRIGGVKSAWALSEKNQGFLRGTRVLRNLQSDMGIKRRRVFPVLSGANWDGEVMKGMCLLLVHKIRVTGTHQRVVWHRWVATPPQHTGTVNLRVQWLSLAGQQRGNHLEALSSEISWQSCPT